MNRQESSEGISRGREKRDLSRLLALPTGLLHDYAQIEMYGNRELVIDGCRGILELGEESLRLNLGKNICRITGRSLLVRCMTADSIVIEGYIRSVEFPD